MPCLLIRRRHSRPPCRCLSFLNRRSIPVRAVVLLWALAIGAAIPPHSGIADEPKPAADQQVWQSLFDGKTLKNWQITKFGGEGKVSVDKGTIVMETGNDMTGITYDGKPPRTNYEVSLEGMRIEGSDFFCTTTFPVGDDPCSLVVGGWAGSVLGLSNIDGHDASENATTQYFAFENKKWYKVRIRVSDARVECWIDEKHVIDLPRKDRKFGIRPEVELSKPLGISTWQTTGAIRNIRLRSLADAEVKAAAENR